MAQEQVVHALDALACGVQVATDEAIPALMTYNLHPGQVHLHQSRASPLTSLEQDHTHRLASQTLALHHANQTTLRTVEDKWHIPAAHFVLDGHATGTPKLKILLNAPAFLLHRLQARILRTSLQQDPGHKVPIHVHTVAPATHARQRVVKVSRQTCMAALVLDKRRLYSDFLLLHATSPE